jgi:hypothetical protein
VVAGSFLLGAALGTGIGAIKGAEHWQSLTIQTYVAVRRSRDRVILGLAIPFGG